jgi:hypothetical protein
MKEIWTADCETDPFRKGRIPAPFIWGTYCLARDEYEEFETFDQFLDFHLAHGREIIMYAHNGGKFDWHFGLHRLEPFSPLMIISGRLAKFKIGNVEFRDSYNILPVPLSEMKKDDFDYSLLEANVRAKHMGKIRAYLRNDCVYLAQYVVAFLETYGTHLTVAGAALNVWQKLSGEKASHSSESFFELFSNFYYGGRVECFERGMIEEKFEVADINSAYPDAMMKDHPYGTTYEFCDNLPENEGERARCFIELNVASLGAFPYRNAEGGLSFPNDGVMRRHFITGWEYNAASDTGALKRAEILSVIRFHRKMNFACYVEHFYKQKAESVKASPAYVFAKNFLVNLYGKWAANPDKYDEFMVVPEDCIEGAQSDGYEYTGKVDTMALVSRDLPEEKRRYFNVAVAASITGFVRAKLWRAIRQCRGPIYCDTDSIAARDVSALDLDPTKLGAWDVEAVCDRGAVAGKKMYAFHMTTPNKKGEHWKTASKGVRLSAAEIVKVAEGEEIAYTSEAPSFSIKNGKRFISRKIRLTG